jgi:hypothetical protein
MGTEHNHQGGLRQRDHNHNDQAPQPELITQILSASSQFQTELKQNQVQTHQKLASDFVQTIVSLCTRLQQDQKDGANAESQLRHVTSRLARIETLLTMDTNAREVPTLRTNSTLQTYPSPTLRLTTTDTIWHHEAQRLDSKPNGLKDFLTNITGVKGIQSARCDKTGTVEIQTIDFTTLYHIQRQSKIWLDRISAPKGTLRTTLNSYTVVVHNIQISSMNMNNKEEIIHRLLNENSIRLHLPEHIIYIGWLAKSSTQRKKHTSVVVGFARPENADIVLERGLLWGGRHHNATIFVDNAKVTQCSNCYQLGHLGTRCRRKARCSHCAEETHRLADCPSEAMPRCVNCDKSHPSTAAKCPSRLREQELGQERRQKAPTRYLPIPLFEALTRRDTKEQEYTSPWEKKPTAINTDNQTTIHTDAPAPPTDPEQAAKRPRKAHTSQATTKKRKPGPTGGVPDEELDPETRAQIQDLERREREAHKLQASYARQKKRLRLTRGLDGGSDVTTETQSDSQCTVTSVSTSIDTTPRAAAITHPPAEDMSLNTRPGSMSPIIPSSMDDMPANASSSSSSLSSSSTDDTAQKIRPITTTETQTEHEYTPPNARLLDISPPNVRLSKASPPNARLSNTSPPNARMSDTTSITHNPSQSAPNNAPTQSIPANINTITKASQSTLQHTTASWRILEILPPPPAAPLTKETPVPMPGGTPSEIDTAAREKPKVRKANGRPRIRPIVPPKPARTGPPHKSTSVIPLPNRILTDAKLHSTSDEYSETGRGKRIRRAAPKAQELFDRLNLQNDTP